MHVVVSDAHKRRSKIAKTAMFFDKSKKTVSKSYGSDLAQSRPIYRNDLHNDLNMACTDALL